MRQYQRKRYIERKGTLSDLCRFIQRLILLTDK